MKHPILNGSGYKLYSLVWAVVILTHGLILYFYYQFDALTATLDSLVFNLLFGAIAPGFWYIVTFGSLSKDELSLVGTHVGSAAVVALLWFSLSAYLLGTIFANQSEYLQFLSDSKIWRGIIGVLYYSISVLIFYLIKYYQDMQDRLNHELELQNLLKDSELRMLKSQINPHFIFNSLNSVSALTAIDPERAREMVIKLSDFLRYSLGKDSAEMNTLDQEIQNVSLYLDIEKVRFGEKLGFEKQIAEECLPVTVPNLILQPLFENAIKYGVYDSLEPVKIQLVCERKESFLSISVINNFDPESVASKGEGIGLENVRKRLALVFGQGDLVEAGSAGSRFNVTLKIPIKQPNHE